MAAGSLVQLFRSVNPQLFHRKDRVSQREMGRGREGDGKIGLPKGEPIPQVANLRFTNASTNYESPNATTS